MNFKKLSLRLITCGVVFWSAGLCIVKDYKVGTEFKDIFNIGLQAGKKVFPSPPPRSLDAPY